MATRRTKILATLGPATADPARIGELIVAGADAIRLNFSHGNVESHRAGYAAVRAQSARLGKCLTVLQDLGGPKIRTGRPGQPIFLRDGDTVRLAYSEQEGATDVITSSFAPLFASVTPGQRVLIDDGRLELLVTGVGSGVLQLQVLEGGVLDSRKGIHVPGSAVQTSALMPKDREDLHAGIALGVDMAALSFVQTPDDVRQAREEARAAGVPDLPIVAKIERPAAVERINEIVDVADAVMVARGDLGIELPLETVPAVQKHVIRAARRRGIPVIVATEVLESMRTSPRPTRAEVTDAAHAVDEGADTIMLSGETAVGAHPARVVATLAGIIEEAERAAARDGGGEPVPTDDVKATRHGLALCEAAVKLASRAGASAIVAVTKAGMTPRLLAALRPSARIIAATANPRTAHRLGLVWGISPVVTEGTSLDAIRDTLLARMLAPAGSTVVFVAMHAALGRDAHNYLLVEQI